MAGFTVAAGLTAVAGLTSPVAGQVEPERVVRLDSLVAIGVRGPERKTTQSLVLTDVVSRELLRSTGVTEPWQQLQRLIPSVNVPHIPVGDNHMRPVTLRGLSPHHVLVLVNGRRRHAAPVLLAGPSVPATSFTDIGAIPSIAIERIEVLHDGAAAQYGSDAIGGVVNIVLRSGAGAEVNATAGSVMSSEGGRTFTDGREFRMAGAWGLANERRAAFTLSGEAHDRRGTNRAYPDRRPQYFPNDPRNSEAPRRSSYLGNGDERGVKFVAVGSVPLGGETEVYASGSAAGREGVTRDAFFRRPLDPRTVRVLHPDGFLPVIGSSIRDVSASAGVRGAIRDWKVDVSAGGGGSRVAYDVSRTNNASLGAASPVDFDVGSLATQQWSSNVDVTRALRVGSVPLDVALGAELRLERYAIEAGEPDAWRDGQVPILDGPLAGQPAAVGAQGMIGIRPADEVTARRTSAAVYAEGTVRPVQRLEVQGALRGERYSDFGTTSDGKLAARLALPAGFAVRGSAGTGFRAPSLMEQHFSSTRTVYQPVNGVNTVLTVRTFPVDAPEARILGATSLRPEHAVVRSAGVVWDAPRLPRVTVDVHQVDITDRITLGASVTDTSIIRLFEENGMRGIGGGNFLMNGVDTRTRGVDVVAGHAFDVRGVGVFRLNVGWNHSETEVTRVAPPPAPLARFGGVLFNRTSRGILERGQPRQTLSVRGAYDAGRFGVMLHGQRSGPTAQLDQARPEFDQVVRARWIADARFAYRFGRRGELALSVTNLFDAYPDEWLDFRDGLNATGPSMQGIFRHPGALSAYGMDGRVLRLQLAY